MLKEEYLSLGQEEACEHVGTEGGDFTVRSENQELNIKPNQIITVKTYTRRNKYRKPTGLLPTHTIDDFLKQDLPEP